MRRSETFALGLLLFGMSAPQTALAFCRSTTCQDSAETCARDENNCKTTGAPLFWKTRCVGFSIQKDGTANLPFDQVTDVITKSFLTWTDVDCGGSPATMTFSRLADVSCHATEYNDGAPNANIILFQDNIWRYKGLGNTLAKTTVTFDHTSGEILDADIELNFAFNDLTVGDTDVHYDLQSILTHEIGHFIGLDHSPELDATMNANYTEGDTSLRTLAPDDIAAACTVYDPARTATCSPTPRGGLGDACIATAPGCGCELAHPRETPLGIGLSAVAAALLFERRLRKRKAQVV